MTAHKPPAAVNRVVTTKKPRRERKYTVYKKKEKARKRKRKKIKIARKRFLIFKDH